MNGDLLLVVLIIIGLIGRSPIITTAACILLVIKLIGLDRYFPTMERQRLGARPFISYAWRINPFRKRSHFDERYFICIYHLARYYCAPRRGDCHIYEWQGFGITKSRPTINCGSCHWFYFRHHIYARHSSRTINGCWDYGVLIEDCLLHRR